MYCLHLQGGCRSDKEGITAVSYISNMGHFEAQLQLWRVRISIHLGYLSLMHFVYCFIIPIHLLLRTHTAVRTFKLILIKLHSNEQNVISFYDRRYHKKHVTLLSFCEVQLHHWDIGARCFEPMQRSHPRIQRFWPFKMKPLCCLQTFCTDHWVMQWHIPE
jgi:hypothetical protein